MKELFIDDLHHSIDKIQTVYKKYLCKTIQYVLLLTENGEYKTIQKSSNHSKFEKVNKTILSNYTTEINDKTIYINDIHLSYTSTQCIPNIKKELIIKKQIFKLFLESNIHLIIETIHFLQDTQHDNITKPLNQSRCYFELHNNIDENNKIVENELVQWLNIIK